MRRIDLVAATMQGWSRLDPAQRDKFSRRSSVRRCGSTGFRCGIGSGSGSEIGRSPLRSIWRLCNFGCDLACC